MSTLCGCTLLWLLKLFVQARPAEYEGTKLTATRTEKARVRGKMNCKNNVTSMLLQSKMTVFAG